MSVYIESYHARRSLEFYSGNCGFMNSYDKGPKEGQLYLGTEVETDNDSGDEWNSDELEQDLADCSFMPFFMATDDGSLNYGAEFVSQPATLEAWEAIKESTIKPGFSHLISSGLRSHQTTTCGLHVHMSRTFFDIGDGGASAISNIIYMVEKNWAQFSQFARREESRYAKRYFHRDSFEDTLKKVYKKKLIMEDVNNGDRYMAVNISPVSTVELRFFKGTLNPETYYATLQLVDNLARFCKAHTIDEVSDCTLFDVIHYKHHKELDAYCQRIDLVSNKEAKYTNNGSED